jgi:choline dehydrogenase-like flavoprotein
VRNAVTIIIGSGVAAASLSRRMLSNNSSSKVLILEAGREFPIANYRTWLDFLMTKISPTTAFEDAKADAEINHDGGFGLVGARMLARGGSTNHWGGWCPRMKPEDFHLGEVRRGSVNWPITYNDLAHYYTQAEVLLNVCGDSKSASVPRFGDSFPHPPVPFTAFDHLLIPTLENLGYGYEALPIARDPNRCRTTGTCRYCPLDARYNAASDLNSLAGNFKTRLEIRTNSPVRSIKMRSSTAASGVVVAEPPDGKLTVVEGDRVVIAAGTIESAKLLLASASAAWPNGIGNGAGHVGRHLVTHPLLRGVGRIPLNAKRLEQEIDFPTMACRHFDSEIYQAQGKMFFVRDGKFLLIPIADKLIAGETVAQVNADIISGTRIELRAFIEPFADDANRVSLASGITAVGLPRTKIQYREPPETVKARVTHQGHLQDLLYAAGLKETSPLDAGGPRADHAASTCRMSAHPSDGVVDKNLQVHNTDNLYVCSNAVFPNIGAVNPTLTLVALALRLGDHISL